MAQAYKALTVKQEEEKLSLLSKTQTELNAIIQELAINAIAYSIKHNDIRPANRLVSRFDGGLRKQTLVAFLEVHGHIKWETEDVDTPCFVFHKKKEEPKEFDHEKLAELMWYKAKQEAVTSTIPDVEDDVRKLLKKIQGRISKGKAVKHAGLTAYLEDAIEQWTIDNVEAKKSKENDSPADQANAAQNVSDIAKAA